VTAATAATEGLQSRGMTSQSLLTLVGDVFGTPKLVTVTGSIAAGYGNRESDIDIYVAVPGEVMQVPVPAYEGDYRVDVRYFTWGELTQWPTTLPGAWPPPAAGAGRKAYMRRKGALHAAVRFFLGWPLLSDDDATAWAAELAGPWLVDCVQQWWQVEATRRLLAARWLDTDLVRQPWERLWLRYADAALAALELRAVVAGHPFFGPKWLPRKFEALGDDEGLALLRETMRWGDEAQLPAFRERCLQVVAEAVGDGPGPLRWHLTPADGVSVDDYLAGRLVVSRWGLRGLELPKGNRALLTVPQRQWSGPIHEPPPPVLRTLFAADMTWLTLVEDGDE
jgi:hypothetical protein